MPRPAHLYIHLVARSSRNRLGIGVSSEVVAAAVAATEAPKVLGGSGRFSREVGAEVVQGGLVAPYAGVHLTRRWCAAVRRGQHTKSGVFWSCSRYGALAFQESDSPTSLSSSFSLLLSSCSPPAS